MVFPSVDYMLVSRKELAPRRWFKSSAPDITLLSWPDARVMLEPYMQAYNDGTYSLDYDNRPESLAGAIRKLAPLPQKPTLLAMDAVLDRDIIDKFVKGR